MSDLDPPAQPHDRATLPDGIPEAYRNYVPKSPAAARVLEQRIRAARESFSEANASRGAGEDLGPQAHRSPTEAPVCAGADHEAGRSQSASHPAGRGWTPLSRDLGIPGEHGPDGPAAALGCSAVFTRELRVRFLDHLAFNGNARAAARRVGVSHETVYRKRRQDAAFAALWDAALVHARHYSESELATRAHDGIEVPVWHRGEIVGYQVKQDSRLLLAHLGWLDKRVENDAAARACAGRFDELLAGYAGHEAPEGFAEAAREALDWRERGTAPELPPTRAEYVAYYRGLALEAAAAGAEKEAMDDAGEEAGAEWDAWHGGALARVGAIVEGKAEREGEGVTAPLPQAGGAGGGHETPHSPTPDPSRLRDGEPDAASNPPPFTGEVPKAEGASVGAPANPPYEIKSAQALTRPISAAWDRVTGVNPRDNCAGSAPFQSPYIAPVTLISRERGTRCTPS
jgi:hypothetical protein